jgi:uncharacterized membrane protein
MLEFLRSPIVQAVVLVLFVLIAATVAWHALQRYRSRIGGDDTPSDHLTFFREMRQRGELSETEFRSIKTALGTKLREQIESSDPRE